MSVSHLVPRETPEANSCLLATPKLNDSMVVFTLYVVEVDNVIDCFCLMGSDFVIQKHIIVPNPQF